MNTLSLLRELHEFAAVLAQEHRERIERAFKFVEVEVFEFERVAEDDAVVVVDSECAVYNLAVFLMIMHFYKNL